MRKMLSESNFHNATEPEQLVMLWYRQNDAGLREADQKAFDQLTKELRAIVNDACIQLFCPALLLGQKRYGSAAMELACERLLREWENSRRPA